MNTPDAEPTPAQIALEAKLTFLERTVEVMSSVVEEQSDKIALLEHRVTALSAKMSSTQDGALRPHDDPPPHH